MNKVKMWMMKQKVWSKLEKHTLLIERKVRMVIRVNVKTKMKKLKLKMTLKAFLGLAQN